MRKISNAETRVNKLKQDQLAAQLQLEQGKEAERQRVRQELEENKKLKVSAGWKKKSVVLYCTLISAGAASCAALPSLVVLMLVSSSTFSSTGRTRQQLQNLCLTRSSAQKMK